MQEKNIESLRAQIAERGLSALLVTHLPDIRWATGFSGSNGLLLVSPSASVFLSDGRYAEQARSEVRGAEVFIPGYDLLGFFDDEGLFRAEQPVGFQAEHMTVRQLRELERRFPTVDWVPLEGFFDELITPKTAAQVESIRRAQRITEAVFEELLPLIRPGVTEKEIAAEVVYRQLRHGAQRMSFEPIVASGPNGALPHVRPTDREFRKGELIVLDFGCVVEGYASDMTRTVALGEPGEEARTVYATVLEAQVTAIEAARAGMPARELDAAARDVIEAAGYGPAFSHSLGHGVGLDVHEPPRVGRQSEAVLPEGAVVTIEPGIYLAGRFGVRIEDLLWLRADGPENLTRATKELLVL